jgi:hypothetical protein
LGSIERAILKVVERDTRSYRNMPPLYRRNNPLALRLTVDDIAFTAYPDWYDRPADGGYRRLPTTPAQRKAITRALHSFVRKHPQYVLTGGKGRAVAARARVVRTRRGARALIRISSYAERARSGCR